VAVGRGGLRAASQWIGVNTSSQDDEAARAAALAAILAEELKGIGVSVDDTELAAITDALTRGGAPAVELAMFIEQQINKPDSPGRGTVPEECKGGDPPLGAPKCDGDPIQATGGAAPAFQQQVDSMIRDLSSGPNASLAISQILLRKLKQFTKK
jgi:hypothetical protein